MNFPFKIATDSKQTKGRRLVIPDIHGCSSTFRALLQKINLTKDDVLFFLGDYIDKGIDSKGVIDEILRLESEGYTIFLLRGNHEQTLLESIEEYPENPLIFHKAYKLENLLHHTGQIEEKYHTFLKNLYFYIELEDYFLVHAGFNFDAENPFQDFEEMLWLRDVFYDEELAKSKAIIFGHQPTPLIDIQYAIQNNSKVICLDNGAVFYDFAAQGYGKLLCFDLDSKKLFFQKNLEQQRLESNLI
ncbi:metallophosphoesterase family protein [Bernardetia sp.]|uniref:metallophosphoesterase family protein n=1 Tax=Bernardetia sp. TaxID=1937974 RepID=UPI0025BBE4D4|nr:metallophosphoesterase family protein [Bernardetia sp.]